MRPAAERLRSLNAPDCACCPAGQSSSGEGAFPQLCHCEEPRSGDGAISSNASDTYEEIATPRTCVRGSLRSQ